MTEAGTLHHRGWQGLRPHQSEAADRVCAVLMDHDRAQVVMPCGTGKTRVGIAVATRLRSRLVLVVVPTLGLVRQTAAAWREVLGSAVDVLFVCSDTSLAVAEDASAPRGLGAPVSTDVPDLAHLLRRARSRPAAMAVAFATYASVDRALAAAAAAGLCVDLVVADEAHHCAGDLDAPWGVLARHGAADRAPVRHRLFLTATPRTHLGTDSGRASVVGMDDQDAFGRVAYRLSLGEAIRRGLLSDYRVATVGVTDAQWRDLSDGPARAASLRSPVVVARDAGRAGAVIPPSTLAATFALGRTMGHYPLRRVVSFHSRVRDARAYASTVPHLLRRVRHPGVPSRITATATYAALPADARAAIIRQLEGAGPDHAVIASNVRCLSEGVDIPALDAVLFADPRRGLVDVVQAVGRVLRPHPDKAAGTVILPVLMTPDGDDLASEVRFGEMLHVLQVLREHDTELGGQLDEMRRDAGRGREFWRSASAGSDGPLRLLLPHGLPDSFVRAFALRIVRGSSSAWDERLGALEAWAARHGHSRIPTSEVVDGFRLGRWAHEQRTLRARGLLPASRARQMDELPGWTWTPWAAAWERAYDLVQQYVREHGHSKVPQSHRRDGFALGAWVKAQRELQQKGRLPLERARRLERLPGWYWRASRPTSSGATRPSPSQTAELIGEPR